MPSKTAAQRHLMDPFCLPEEHRANLRCFTALLLRGATAGEQIEAAHALGVSMISDHSLLGYIADRIVWENPKQADAWESGKAALHGFFFGRALAACNHRADPHVLSEEIGRALNERKCDRAGFEAMQVLDGGV